MVEFEVEQGHYNDGLEVVVPSETLTVLFASVFLGVLLPRSSSLAVDRITGIEDSSFPEMLLIALLHLDDKRPAVRTST